MAATSDDADRLVDVLAPTAVVVDTELPNDGARRVSQRITAANPGLTVVMSAANRFGDGNHERAGAAAQLTRCRDVEGLAERILGTATS